MTINAETATKFSFTGNTSATLLRSTAATVALLRYPSSNDVEVEFGSTFLTPPRKSVTGTYFAAMSQQS